MSRLTRQISLAGLLQFGLLAYSYTDPTGRMLAAWLYFPLLIANSLLLTWLAYRAFQAQRPVAASAAAMLAFPGLFVGTVVVALWRAKR